jgi:hypothetical protein
VFPVDAFLLLALGVSSVVTGEPCGCSNSTAPSCITLVGSLAGTPAASFGQFTVVVRDLANNPLAGAMVTIDVSGAIDLAICSDQHDPGAIVNCAYGTVSKRTAADGSVSFTMLGHSNGSGNANSLLSAGKIFANGNLIQSPTVSAYDLDGSGGVGANDLSAWLVDFSTGNPYGRSDYDCSGGLGANDQSFWLQAFGSGTMAESCGASCP